MFKTFSYCRHLDDFRCFWDTLYISVFHRRDNHAHYVRPLIGLLLIVPTHRFFLSAQ